MKLCVVIPAYNASRHLGAVVERIDKVRVTKPLEAVIVDDGSKDDTAALAKELARTRPWLAVITRVANGGYGAAMKDGLAHALRSGAERAASIHADGQYAPEVLSALLTELDERRLDLLQGSRIAGGGALRGGMPLYKYAANWALNELEQAVLGLRLSDFHSGYLVYGQRALQSIPFERLSNSFDFDLEVLATARARGLDVGEGPIPTHYGDEISHLNPLTYGMRILRVLWRFKLGAYAALLAMIACATGPTFPWPNRGRSGTGPASRDDVVTVNDYHRDTSQVLVRKVKVPTRANLDYAAYRANFMNADPAPEGSSGGGANQAPDTSHPFGGKLAKESLSGSIGSTALTAAERARGLAVSPLVELMVSKHVPGADRLEDAVAAVRAETWGLPGGPQLVRQTAALLFLHDPGANRPVEMWLQIEFAPWFHGFSGMPDEDGDGFPDLYGRIDSTALGDPAAMVAFIRTEYEGRRLTPAEVKSWAHQLASYWYPSYNTDLVPPAASWPAADTEAFVRAELGARTFANPAVVMRGKPQGKAVYNIFLVEDGGPTSSVASASKAEPAVTLPRTKPSPDPKPVMDAVTTELAAHGSWSAWAAEVGPLDHAFKARLQGIPQGAKAFSGADGFLFFRRSVAYATGGDLTKQRGDRNPLPAISAFRQLLASHGVDLLFVPVPTKLEIYPEKAASSPTRDAGLGRFAGKIVNPFERKLLLDLAAAGVETVDLLPALLAERAKGDPLYQAQDTHWTSRGLELAAKSVSDRIRRYPWYKALSAHRRSYHVKDASFTRYGDLHSRLPENEKARYKPETLVGHQVLGSDGQPYEDDPDSPIVVLGDSFTGVYELMDCEHAGVSAHLARELGYPVDLVMSYGGGPNVRQKLLRRGEAALDSKRLVVWMMTARDLYAFEEGWQPLGQDQDPGKKK